MAPFVEAASARAISYQKQFHKDNLRHLSRFPDFFLTFRILSNLPSNKTRENIKLEITSSFGLLLVSLQHLPFGILYYSQAYGGSLLQYLIAKAHNIFTILFSSRDQAMEIKIQIKREWDKGVSRRLFHFLLTVQPFSLL